MHSKIFTGRPWCTAVLITGLLASLPGATLASVGVDPPSPARFDYPTSADHLLISYSVRHDELAENDPTPLLRIYGDGTVHVHIPRYMRGAGAFRMTLDEQALRALVDSLAQNGVLGFEHAQVQERLRQAESARFARDQTHIHISDSSWSTFRVNLSLYDPMGTGLVREGLDREVVWRDVAWHAEQYPNVTDLQGLSAAEQTLRAFLRHPSLTPLAPTEN